MSVAALSHTNTAVPVPGAVQQMVLHCLLCLEFNLKGSVCLSFITQS